ncbi:hypothetical protein CTEN210_12788 [Chaetoceros tenuissimus]|uniref:Pan3 C-terminal knob domain-containing protein n=1 Tax=Chaetoceros tenuissimus TaxID=426638 RepID=A0AAD3HA74_9STRA|nr:hypothetical protein CTEN210_12788 [Chaetoceros tenuissimus]
MDELSDSLNKLSTKAKVWQPGQGFTRSTSSAPSTTSSVWGDSTSHSQVSNSADYNNGNTNTAAGSSFNANATNWSPSKTKEFVPSSFQKQHQHPVSTNNTTTTVIRRDEQYYYKTAATTKDEPVVQQETSVPRGATAANSSTFQTNNTNSAPHYKSLHSYGIPNHTLWNLYRLIASHSSKEMSPSDPRYKAIPPYYTNAYPLEEQTTQRSSFGYHTLLFKVTSQQDGRLYVLRRFDNVRGVNQKIASLIHQKWKSHISNHPNICRLCKCFFNYDSRALYFVHKYEAMSHTLHHTLFMGMDAFHPLHETTVWSYCMQLLSAVRSIHKANLAVRSLQLNHILVCLEAGSGMDPHSSLQTNRVRLKLNCIGIVDALEFEDRRSFQELQMEDMKSFGRILLSLCFGREILPSTPEEVIGQCELFLRKNYSPELYNLTMALLARPRPGRMGMMIVNPPTVEEVCRAVADHAFDEMDAAYAVVDGMDEALAMEYESGRAFRLLMKFAFINERPEFGVDPRWSESGDCYVLKLFRDYVFHQADESGRPVMDLGHVVTALNKLDAADEEKIVLAARDGKTIMVVSYAEIARYLENAFAELCNSSVSMHQALGGGGGNKGWNR